MILFSVFIYFIYIPIQRVILLYMDIFIFCVLILACNNCMIVSDAKFLITFYHSVVDIVGVKYFVTNSIGTYC